MDRMRGDGPQMPSVQDYDGYEAARGAILTVLGREKRGS
jgi:hypothetical protein